MLPKGEHMIHALDFIRKYDKGNGGGWSNNDTALSKAFEEYLQLYKKHMISKICKLPEKHLSVEEIVKLFEK